MFTGIIESLGKVESLQSVGGDVRLRIQTDLDMSDVHLGDSIATNGICLTVIEWGDGLFGIEAASRKFFPVHASQLSASQAAYLAAMVTNPRYYQLHRNDRHLLHKAGVIMQRMRSADLPTDAD